jgi:nitrate reductase NapAB chaperone NapD
MAIVGALVQTEPKISQVVQKQLATFEDVTVHPFEHPGQMALIIEREDLNQIHHLLTNSIETTDGVLAVYPIYTHLDEVES